MGHKECLVLGAVGITEGFFPCLYEVLEGIKGPRSVHLFQCLLENYL